MIFVGIDWSEDHHDACIVDVEGRVLAKGRVPEGVDGKDVQRRLLLAHDYRPKLIGLAARQHTGWLQDGVYAPHTAGGFKAPANKTLLLLGNGFLARRGLKKARKAAGAGALTPSRSGSG